MKHYLLQTANGLHTLPCNNSHGKSLHFFNFRFSLFTPLLVLFLLIVGNSPAWARPTIYGEGLPGLNASGATNWDSNTKEMSAYGEADTYYTEFLNVSASSDNKYRFKIAVNGSGNWWDGAMNSGNTNESMGNVDIVNGKDGDNQISFKMPFDGDVYIFYKSTNANDSKVWIVAVPLNIAAPPTGQSNPGYDSGRALKTDLIFKSDRTGWGSGIKFTRSFTTTYKHVTSYILPTKKNTEDGKIRFEMYYGDSKYIDGKSIPAQLSTSTPRRIIYLWDGNQNGSWTAYTLPTYPIRKSGWKLFVNEYNSGNAINLDANGEATLTLTGGNTYHFFIANTDYATNISNYSSDICSSPAVHSVNCFGGCYIDKNNSSNVTFSEQQVYKSSSCGTLVKSVVAAQDMRGVFKVDGSGAKDVTFNFDGGVITINAVNHIDAGPKYTITLHPNNGGSEIVRENVPEGSNSSATELNLSEVTYGKGTATWYTDAACTTPFTTVTGNMHLYAKWGVSGNYYFVSCLQTANDDGGNNGNWSNNYGQQLSYSFIAPSGHMPFEIIKDKDWGQKINGGNYADMFDNSQSDVTISAAHGHMDFTLNEPKKVTVSYNGKVTIKTENYSFDNSKTWRIKTSWGNGGNAWNYNTIMTNNGTTNATAILRNVPAGQHSFVVTAKENDNDAMATVGTETFNALYVDTSNPSSGLTWNNTSARRDGSDNFNSTTPQTDNRWRNCSFTLSNASDIRITFDGGKIRCDIVAPNIVTFKDGETTLSTQEVSSGNKATKPADPTKAGYTFVKWQLDGSDYDFSSAVNSNITLNAVWAYKGIESISLNESEHMTWVGNSDFTLTPTYSPSDLITKTITWSSNNTSVATVSNGTVQAMSAGSATITCTITDMLGYQRSATCEVTVAACEMSTSDLYTMTVTSYNTSTGSSATLSDLWNESTDNDGPASMTITRLAFQKKDAGTTLYAYDDNGTVKVKEDASGDDVQWLLIPTGETYTPSWNNGNSCQLYYIKNKATGAYMHRGSVGVNTGNPDWFYSVTNTNATNTATDDYKWFFVYENENQRCIYVKSGVGGEKKSSYKLHTSNQYNSETNTHAAKPMLPVGRTADINAYAKSYNNTNDFNYNTYPNPNYLASLMNTSYYRMNTGATVKANLGNALVKGAVITVRLYADAATSVQLTKVDGTTVIETINLTADTEFEYSYTVNNASPLLGESAFIIKAGDNHAGIASIKVTHTYVANPSNPELSWETDLNGGVTQSALGSTFRHVASSTLSLGAIHYASSDEAVATVAADGTVTPHSAGTTTITATIAAEGCYDEASISYNITLTEASLQEAIDATPVDGTLTLTHNYSENAVINKAITLDAQGHTIDDLTVEYAGDLTLSSELTVRDFTIWAKAGNTSTPAASGQVRNASELKVNRNAYFLYTVDPSGHVQYGWYDFTVPFPINIVSGIKGIQGDVLKEDFRNGVDYAVMEYFGEKQAQGQYPYKKFSGVMQPNKLYTITLDDDYNYNTLRMQKTADGALVANDEVTLNAYAGDDINKNWNGVGNGTLHHADAGISGNYIQVYQSGDRTFLTVDKNGYSLVVGSAFMVQETGIMTLSQATHGALLAPSRYESTPATAIQIATEGKPFSDQLFITASETGGQAYTLGVDVAKAGELGSASVPQIWTNAYNSSLCVHEAQLINGKAQYKLSIYAPVAGAYTLTSKNIPTDYSLYLTQNGMIVSELSDTYTLDLSKGITTEYGLLLTEIYNSPTAIENTQTDKIQTTKIIRNGVLYILHNGKVYNAQGAKVK